jgi:hypothetical protein
MSSIAASISIAAGSISATGGSGAETGGSGAEIRRTRGSIVTAALRGLLLIMLLSEFSPLAPQLFGETMEALGVPGFTVNPERYCLLYKVICIDM